MLEILKGSKKDIKKNIKLLALDYKEKTGRVVCLSCPSDIQYMISSLKTIYKMKNFEFTKEFAQYKNKKGDKTTISNATMTDKKAIEFLKTNPKRISLFKTFPKNWEELVNKKSKKVVNDTKNESEELINKATQSKVDDTIVNDSKEIISPEAQAEAEALAAAGAATGAATGEATGSDKDKDCCDDNDTDGKPCEDCIKKKRVELLKMKVKDLKLAYPDHKYKVGMNKDEYVEIILKA